MSTTNVFEITYRSGTKETVVTDAQSVEDQINRTFGLSPEDASDFGVAVVLVGPYDAEQGAQEELEGSGGEQPTDPQPVEPPQPEDVSEQAEQPIAQPGAEPQP